MWGRATRGHLTQQPSQICIQTIMLSSMILCCLHADVVTLSCTLHFSPSVLRILKAHFLHFSWKVEDSVHLRDACVSNTWVLYTFSLACFANCFLLQDCPPGTLGLNYSGSAYLELHLPALYLEQDSRECQKQFRRSLWTSLLTFPSAVPHFGVIGPEFNSWNSWQSFL